MNDREIFNTVIAAVLLDRLLNSNTWVFRTLVCYFYIAIVDKLCLSYTCLQFSSRRIYMYVIGLLKCGEHFKRDFVI